MGRFIVRELISQHRRAADRHLPERTGVIRAVLKRGRVDRLVVVQPVGKAGHHPPACGGREVLLPGSNLVLTDPANRACIENARPGQRELPRRARPIWRIRPHKLDPLVVRHVRPHDAERVIHRPQRRGIRRPQRSFLRRRPPIARIPHRHKVQSIRLKRLRQRHRCGKRQPHHRHNPTPAAHPAASRFASIHKITLATHDTLHSRTVPTA